MCHKYVYVSGMLFLLWMCTALRFVVARVRNLVARVSAACVFRIRSRTHVLGYADEWREKKKTFDGQESDWSCHAPISLEADNN